MREGGDRYLFNARMEAATFSVVLPLLHCVECGFFLIQSELFGAFKPETFCYRGGRYLGEMVRFCKEDLDIESVTVVTNGSKVVLQETHPIINTQNPKTST